MKTFWMFAGVVVLCGCHRYRPVPLQTAVPSALAPPLAAEEPRAARPLVTPPAENTPSAPAEAPAATVGPPHRTFEQAVSSLNGQLEDVYFAYDHFEISPEAVAVLRRDAGLIHTILRDFPSLRITVEGHCDERGSAEYNLGLGDHRATNAAGLLRQLGLPADNFAPVSYGKEAPQCTESTESCWQLNRRIHLVARTPVTE